MRKGERGGKEGIEGGSVRECAVKLRYMYTCTDVHVCCTCKNSSYILRGIMETVLYCSLILMDGISLGRVLEELLFELLGRGVT